MAIPGPPVFDAETQEAIKTLVAKGVATGLFFATDAVQGTYEELKSRGVEFQQEPTEQPYGVDAGFRDPSGNQMRMRSGTSRSFLSSRGLCLLRPGNRMELPVFGSPASGNRGLGFASAGGYLCRSLEPGCCLQLLEGLACFR